MSSALAVRSSIPPAPRRRSSGLGCSRRSTPHRAGAFTLVSAPPGWGKSVLLSGWAAERGAAWLTLGTRHCDAHRLWADVLEALEPRGRRRSTSSTSIRSRTTCRSGSPTRWRGAAERPVLVLDDLHLLRGPALTALGELLVHGGDALHVVAATRSDPHLPLERLRLSGGLGELRASDLAFTLPEATALLAELGVTLRRSSSSAWSSAPKAGRPGCGFGRPAFGALDQALDASCRSVTELRQQGGRLGQGEREVRRAQLAEPAGQAKALKREVGIRARGRHHVQRGAAVHQQLAERGQRRPAQQVEVVEDEHGALGRARQRVGEPERHVVLERVDVESSIGASARPSASTRRPTAVGVAVARPERQPRRTAVRCPAAQQHGLAPAGGELTRVNGPARPRRAQPEARSRSMVHPREPADGRGTARTLSRREAHRSGGDRAMARAGVCGAVRAHRARWCPHPRRTQVRRSAGSPRTSTSSSPGDWMRSSSPRPVWSSTGPCKTVSVVRRPRPFPRRTARPASLTRPRTRIS